ncbi:hypothetical protein [Shewanella sp. T24-MNA-CIBAN-0130]|uniref:phage adaptor protein n=1 Tax=Shewanella sp. T24-MNA-CIBAN-0130 TaxID=3140470 RepID=UPI00331FD08E
MTFLELCIRVREQSGVSGNGPATTLSQTGVLAKLVSWVIDADMDIQSLKDDWKFLWRQNAATLVTGQQSYTFVELGIADANQGAIGSVFIDNLPALIIDWREWLDDFDQRLPDLGQPTVLSVSPDGKVFVYPVPIYDVAIKTNYYAEPVSLSADADISVIPAKFHDCIVQKALMYYATFEEDMQLYQMANARYESKLTDLCNAQLPSMSKSGGRY